MMVNPTSSGQFAIIRIDFVIGGLGTCIYNRIRVGAKSAQRDVIERDPQFFFDLHVFLLFVVSSFLISVCNYLL